MLFNKHKNVSIFEKIKTKLYKNAIHIFQGKIGFKNMHALLETITLAMQLYFTGESLRNISKALKLHCKCNCFK